MIFYSSVTTQEKAQPFLQALSSAILSLSTGKSGVKGWDDVVLELCRETKELLEAFPGMTMVTAHLTCLCSVGLGFSRVGPPFFRG